jgi:hypothetical protein
MNVVDCRRTLQRRVGPISRSVFLPTQTAILRAPSLWLTAALACLLLVELIPTTGRFLERFDTDIFAGWLAQLVFLSLFIDSVRGLLPRMVTLIPIIFYSSYYLAFKEQNIHISLKSEELRNENPGKIINFDSDLYSIVVEKAEEFVASHYIPVVYTRDGTYIDDGYISYRLISSDNIYKYLLRNKNDVQVLQVYLNNVIQPNVKILKFTERPKPRILSVTVQDDPGEGWKDWNIGTETTSVSLDDRVVGVFKTAFVRRLPAIPFFAIGCRSSTESSRRNCYAQFMMERTWIESRPRSVDLALYDSPASIMLGIRRLSKEEMTDFSRINWNFPPRPAAGEDQAFDALRDVIEGRSPALSWATSFLIAGDKFRLAPFAGGMARRFLDLSRGDNANLPGRRDQAALLAAGIAALGSTEFAGVQDLLADLARKDDVRDEYPLLYLRLADSNPKLYPIYRDQFLAQNATQSQKLLAILAICRMGQADSELISAIKSEWAESDSEDTKPDNYRAALFVALMKLGQEDELRTVPQSSSRVLRGWYDAVLAGRGKTDAGPNNCMPMEWPGGNIYVPPSMAPGLRWVQQQWRTPN